MKVIKYVDVYPSNTGKNDIFFTDENCLSQKMDGCKRYKVIVNIPDYHQVDGQLGPNKKIEVLETTDLEQVKVIEVVDKLVKEK